MKTILLALPLLLSPSCKAVDSVLGIGGSGEPDRTEETIQAGESAIQTAGNMILPGAGGALAVIFGLGARAYVRKRKAAKAS